MNDKNLVRIEGRLGTPPELLGEKGSRRVKLNLGVNYYKKNDEGEFEQSKTDWFQITGFDGKGKLATRAATLVKGDLVQVRGRLSTSEYEKEGVKIKAMNIIAESVKKIDLLMDKQSAEISNHLMAAREAAQMDS